MTFSEGVHFASAPVQQKSWLPYSVVMFHASVVAMWCRCSVY